MGFFNRKKAQAATPQVSTQEFAFMVDGRASGLLALWAADRMGKSSEASANYADEIVEKAMQEDALVNRLKEDLSFHEQHVEDNEIRQKYSDFKRIAEIEFQDEANMGK